MAKVTVGPKTLFYARPALLIGANVDGKPNFMTVAGGGSVNAEPPMVALPIMHSRHTLKGIRQNLTFSVNVPSVDLVKETDYCGLVSGSKVNKVEVCQFKVFYGRLDTAPLIEQCPINVECKVIHILDLGSHALVIGRVEETHISDSCLTEGQLDVSKVNPIVYTTQGRRYMAFGQVIADAYSAGLELKTREQRV